MGFKLEKLIFTTPAEVIAALSVFVNAGKNFDKLLDLRREKLSRAIYKSPSFNGHGNRKGKYRKDSMAAALAEVERIDKKIYELAGNFSALQNQVQDIINRLYPNYNQMSILEWRYINGEQWEEISKHTGFSISHCFLLHDKAIKALLENETGRKEENE